MRTISGQKNTTLNYTMENPFKANKAYDLKSQTKQTNKQANIHSFRHNAV